MLDLVTFITCSLSQPQLTLPLEWRPRIGTWILPCYARAVTDEGFELLTELTGVETIAVGNSIRDLPYPAR